MGSLLYEFLADSFLFDQGLLNEDFASVPMDQLTQELEKYRAYATKRKPELVKEAIADPSSNLTVFCSEPVSFKELKQAAMYMDRYILIDPLIVHTRTKSQQSQIFTKASFPDYSDTGVDQRSLSRDLRFMKEVAPMVAANFVRFAPDLNQSQEIDQGLPLYASDNYFEDVLPSELMNLFKKAARTHTLQDLGEGRFRQEPLRLCRKIAIDFEGDVRGTFLYILHDMQEFERDEADTSRFAIRMRLPDEPPEQEMFLVWVKQSINRSAKIVFDDTFETALTATQLGANFATRSQLRFDALSKVITEPNDDSRIATANAFMNLELPVLDHIETTRLLNLRTSDNEAFNNFRFALNQKLGYLRSEQDPIKAQQQAEDAVRELTEVQLREVKLKASAMRRKVGLSAVGSLFSLAAAVQTHGFSLLSMAASAASGMSAYQDYKKDVKNHPAFFLLKSLNGKEKRLQQF